MKLNVRAYESPAHLWCLYHPLHPLAQVESLQHTCTKPAVAEDEVSTEEIKDSEDEIRRMAIIKGVNNRAMCAYLEKDGKRLGRSGKQQVRSYHALQGA